MKYVVGIDVGTSGCKVILLNNGGKVISSATSSYPMEQPQPGWTEQEPVLWWKACCQACKKLLRDSKINSADVVGVGISGQMHSLVVLDESMEIVRPAILWNDQRTEKQCSGIYTAAGGLDELLKLTNNMMLTGYSGGKILWIKENEPENYERIKHFVLSKDYVRFRLTGILATDKSDASGTGLYDVKSCKWSKPLIDKLGLDEGIFPKVYSSTDCTGYISGRGAEESGLPEGIPVFGGGGDAVLSLISAGITGEKQIGLTLGTSGVAALAMDRCIDNPGGKLQIFCNAEEGKYVSIGCTLSAAGSFKWLSEAIGDYEKYLRDNTGLDEYAQLDQKAETVPPGCDGLLYFPYLMGERCPLFDSNVRASFIGLDASMGKGHLVRAVLEGVVYSLYQVHELMKNALGSSAKEIMVCGGGAKSKLWRQIIADVFGLPVYCTAGAAEGSAYGAALIAGIGAGFWKNADEAASTRTLVSEVLPQSKNGPAYMAQYAKYSEMCEKIYKYK